MSDRVGDVAVASAWTPRGGLPLPDIEELDGILVERCKILSILSDFTALVSSDDDEHVRCEEEGLRDPAQLRAHVPIV
jgi:hypothetical protein